MLMGAARGIYTAIERMGRSKGGQGGRIVNITSTIHGKHFFARKKR